MKRFFLCLLMMFPALSWAIDVEREMCALMPTLNAETGNPLPAEEPLGLTLVWGLASGDYQQSADSIGFPGERVCMLVDVTVTDPAGQPVYFSGYATNADGQSALAAEYIDQIPPWEIVPEPGVPEGIQFDVNPDGTWSISGSCPPGFVCRFVAVPQ